MSEQNYLVTARKYRPQLFGDVVSQEHVSETLKNAIRLDRLAHAYMFTGPRGVGKTTAARILAKAINCTTPLTDREDQAEPCRRCDSCKSFEEGRNLNIIEIDAASNNKVDDVRDLRDTVRIPPQGAKMKVYIIDEVHMLTTSAFNALLKTLEEPPPYVSFIFATTEPHKVLPTIQSRCQRFDFRRIAVPEIVQRLSHVCAQEQITADEASLMLIARKGDGALRDALSVFDQAVSLCGSNVVYDELIKALGVVDADLYFDVTDAAKSNDVGRMIKIVEQIVQAGYDLQEFLDGLAEHLRNLLVIKSVGDRSLVEATTEVQSRYEKEAEQFTESVLLRFVHIVGETSDALRNTRQPRLRLEMALLKMASLPSAVDIRTALEKIEKLEIIARDPVASPAVAKPVDKKNPETKAEVEKKPDLLEPKVSESPPVQEESKSMAATDVEEPVLAVDPAPATPASEPAVAPAPSRVEKADPAPTKTGAIGLPFDEPALKRSSPKTKNVLPTVSVSESTYDDVAVLPEENALEVPIEVVEAWAQVTTETMESQIRLGSLLRHTTVIGFRNNTIQVGVPDAFHERILRGERSNLLKHLETVAGKDLGEILFVVSDQVTLESDAERDDSFNARAFLQTKCEENPAVQSLVERFGGEIVW